MSHNMNLLSSHFTISRALHSYFTISHALHSCETVNRKVNCETVNRKVNCGLTPNKNGNCAEKNLILPVDKGK